MFPTPDLSHLSTQDYYHVYEPAEDTFALLDALEQDADKIAQIKPKVCLEIGVGSGCVSTFMSQIAGNDSKCLYLGTDINEFATKVAVKTALQNKTRIDTIKTDLFGPLIDRLKGSIDVILFNPPYVPTTQEEEEYAQQIQKSSQQDHHIYAAWAGGKDGLASVNIFLERVKDMLSKNGLIYLVGVQENHPEELCKYLESKGLDSEIILKRKAGYESLFVIRSCNNNNDKDKDSNM